MKPALFAAMFLALATAACETPQPPEPEVRIVEVQVPVARSCVPENLSPAPAYVDTVDALRAAADAAARFLLLAAGREQRVARLAEIEPVVAGCRD